MPYWSIKKYRSMASPFSRAGLLAIIICGVINTVSASTLLRDELQPYTASYAVKVSGISPTLHRKLEKTGENSWQLSNKVSFFFFGFKETAQFDINGNTVIPQSFSHRERGKNKSSELRFDWSNRTVIDQLNSDEPLALPTPSWDELSWQVQLYADIHELGTAFTKKDYPLVYKTRLTTHTVEKIGEERISTPAGDFNAIKFKKYYGDNNKHILIWVAKDWDYMILRLNKVKDGKIVQRVNIKKGAIAGNAIKGL